MESAGQWGAEPGRLLGETVCPAIWSQPAGAFGESCGVTARPHQTGAAEGQPARSSLVDLSLFAYNFW